MKKIYTNHRLKRLWALAAVAGALIAFRLIDIQFIRYDYYAGRAERNRTQIIFQDAPRGNILTREGTVVAGSRPSFELYFLPAAAGAQTFEETAELVQILAPLLKQKAETLALKINRSVSSGRAVVIAENVSAVNVLPIAEIQNFYPGIYLIEEAKRYYPHGVFASHLLGFLGNINGAAWKERDLSLNYRLDSKTGRSGMEKRFERDLRGSDGGVLLEVDYRGRVKRIIEDKPFTRGGDIYTTLHFDLQRATEEALKKNATTRGRAAAVALDPATGAVLAIASTPAFDPNIFVPFSDEDTDAARRRVRDFNTAVQGAYPPASTFKVITALAALEENMLNVNTLVYCDGGYDTGSRIFKCTHHHGWEDFWGAMADSCNVYFYTLSNRIGALPIEKVERAFMFGRPTGIEIAGERNGNLFGPARRARNKSYWFLGDTLNLAIGQGELLVTPVKMAQFAAALASRGKVWKPFYVQKIVAADGKETFMAQPEQLATAEFSGDKWDIIFKALKGVVDSGTGRVTKLKDFTVYGKTGTAQNPHGDDHAWFIGFASRPKSEPDIALAVFVENGIGGAASAAPVARDMFKAFYGIMDPPPAPVQEVKAAPARAAQPIAVDVETLKAILEGRQN